MGNFIKSHSNYVLKKKHQNVSDGTIWERDITTIGGVNFFAPGQTPIYRDNNFIITIRNDGKVANQYNQGKWVESPNDNNTWTLENVNSITSNLDEQDDTKIVIKQDYYDFTDFAYYGSLTELFRSSITDIINRFPGELYGSSEIVYYETTETIDGESYTTTRELGKETPSRDENRKVTGYTVGETTYYELKNPFGINIHSSKKPVGSNPLKYFAENGYSAYTINGTDITKWTVSKLVECAVAGELIGTVTINDTYTIYIYAGTGGSIHYMHTDMSGMHITPNSSYLNQFYNDCDSFQRLLMNPETTPKYKAEFSVIYENDYGYYRRMESFIFPTSDGGYNIDPTAYGFNDYTARFARIGEFYDERFTDNMWRSMTHEAIKNFDWTYTREYNGDAEEYVLGGERIQKALRVFAREFDEVKSYIDSINSVNRVTYDDRGNLPNYFLTDVCENDGWDIIQVIPYSATSETFIQDSKKTVTPYSGGSNPYFMTCCSDGATSLSADCRYKFTYVDEETGEVKDGIPPYYTAATAPSGCKVITKVAPYKDTKQTYTYMDVNNEFLRRLKLNSRYIWRHKGTIEGIEMILAMFGLKSDRWCKKLKADTACNVQTPDYTITEYTRSTNGITDPWNAVHQMHTFDWVNSTKTINYDYRTISTYSPKGNLNVSYIPYQGLPVRYVGDEENTGATRTLYPNFEKYEQYDGNPYFQMNGGWLSKTASGKNDAETPVSVTYGFQYDNDGQPLFVSGDTLYKETVRSIRRVKDLSEMLSIPSSELKNGSICYVETVSNNALIVDGEVFEIHDGNFITLTRSGGVIKVGDKYFDDKITVYNKSGEEYTYTLDDKLDGYEVYAYINGNNFICKNGSYSIDLYKIINNSSPTDSNYFKLNDIEYSNSVAISSAENGWLRLNTNSCEYKRINTIWNYYKGNNPHNGNLNYDKGEEYYEYFRHLFKYPYENDLFDDRCYDNYYSEIDEVYSGASFSAITELTADTKVHYFGNYIEKGTNAKKIFGTNYTIGGGIKGISETQPYTYGDTITNHIMNDKRIKISFNMKNAYNGVKESNHVGKAELKFIDEIVMNYLTQLVPSNAIFEVEYNFKNGGLPKDYCK